MEEPHFPVAALRGLEPGTVDAVFDHFSPRLNGFLRRMGASVEVAEELVQESFVRLVHHAPRLTDDTRIGAWLFTVARNLWISQRRWAWVDGTRLVEFAAGLRQPGTTPADLVAAGQTEARVEHAVSRLPEVQREVFLLVVGEGLEPAEAARILHISPEAARQRLARARRLVEEALP